MAEENNNDDLGYDELPQNEPKDEVLVSDKILHDMAKLLRSQRLADVTLAVRERRFSAHRLILSARSTYFKNLFESEPDKQLFDLDAAFNPDAFEFVLEYLYTANIVVTRKIADDISEIALKLDIKQLSLALAGFTGTKLTNENVLQEIQRHFTNKNKAALEHSLRFLDHNITKIGLENPQLLTMPFEIMTEIVKRQTLGIEEQDLLQILINWRREQELNNDADTVKRQVTQLAQHLKLHLLQPDAFFNTLKATGWFSTEVLWDTLTEMINSNRGYPIRDRGDNDDIKWRPRKPGPKKLKRKNNNGRPDDAPIAILGQEASGKTTLLYKLKLGEVVTTIPTVGFNVEGINYKSTQFTLTDCGYRVKANWMSLVSSRTAALIWVIDSNNRDVDLLVEGFDLKATFDQFQKPGMPVLVIANKQDLPNARSVAEICDMMGLRDLGIQNWFIQAACATSGDGLYEGIDWIHSKLDLDD